MNLIEALKTGRRIRRASVGGQFVVSDNFSSYWSYEAVLADDWEVEPEPKKKVKRWLWAYKNTGDVYYCHGSLFQTDAEAKVSYGNSIIKLEWSETEFEE